MDIIIQILDFIGFFFIFGGKEYFDDKYKHSGTKIPKVLFYIIGILIWSAIIIISCMIIFFLYNLIRDLLIWITNTLITSPKRTTESFLSTFLSYIL